MVTVVEAEASADEELDTSEDDTGTLQYFILFDKDFSVESSKVQICENIFDPVRVQEFVESHRENLVRVEITWQGLRDVLTAKLEEMKVIEEQFEMYKQAARNTKNTLNFTSIDLFDMNSICLLYTSPSPRDRG